MCNKTLIRGRQLFEKKYQLRGFSYMRAAEDRGMPEKKKGAKKVEAHNLES
jgi:hypothetical protein